MPNEEDPLNIENFDQNREINQKDNKFWDVIFFVWETVKIIAISLAIILPIRYYLVQPFFVKGASMEPNFHNGDYLLIDEISYRFNQPKRGDVIVFRYPKQPSQYFIKRIIGLPGETIEIKNNKVTVYNSDKPQGIVIEEDYLASYQQTLGDSITILEEDEFYVLGDNRLQSSDSRGWGTLDKSFITGRAFVRLWPLDQITKINSISY